MILDAFKAFRLFAAVSAALLLCPLTAAQAQTDHGILPAQAADAPEYELQAPDDETHPMIRLTPDKPQIVKLDSDARSIIVGNPANLNVVMDTTRSLVLIPRDPGATHMTVLGRDGKVIMQRYVIVAAPAETYVRIRRACASAAQGGNCVQTSIYYCPDMCHETKILSSTLGQQQTPPAPLSSGPMPLDNAGGETQNNAGEVAAPEQPVPAPEPATETNESAPSEE
jgi:hypothetical protein